MGRRSIKEITANMTEKELKEFEKERQHRKMVRETLALQKKYGIKYGEIKIPENLEGKERKRFIYKKERRKYHYVKRRVEILKERKNKGDLPSYYGIYITLNKKKLRCEGHFRYRTEAIKRYESLVEENHQSVKFPKTFTKTQLPKKSPDYKPKYEEQIFEILLIKRVSEHDDKISKFRNKEGAFVENEVVDKVVTIIRKDDWLVEETFNECGSNPRYDRKNYSYIFDTHFSEKSTRNTSKRVFYYNRSLFIQYDEDITFFTCKTVKQAEMLYNKLFNEVKKDRYTLFSGQLNQRLVPELVRTLSEKTGMPIRLCQRTIENHQDDKV